MPAGRHEVELILFMIGQALVVGVLAEHEYIGLRRAPVAAREKGVTLPQHKNSRKERA